ncbi:MAG: alcohol dehydrogenase catalytic domain-containing protein, partial [Rhizobiaceae bacterium]
MKAIVCHKYGPIDNLEYAEIDDPVPGPEEVVIKTEKIGVNYADGLLVQGLYQTKPQFPFVPGMEAAGEIVAAGSAVTRWRVGDRVAAFVSTGAYSELVLAEQNLIFPVDKNADATEVVSLICGYGTAYHALKQRARLLEGETLAVTGAAGLTGLAAVELGKIMGTKVIAVASSQKKRDLSDDRGADV